MLVNMIFIFLTTSINGSHLCIFHNIKRDQDILLKYEAAYQESNSISVGLSTFTIIINYS